MGLGLGAKRIAPHSALSWALGTSPQLSIASLSLLLCNQQANSDRLRRRSLYVLQANSAYHQLAQLLVVTDRVDSSSLSSITIPIVT